MEPIEIWVLIVAIAFGAALGMMGLGGENER